MTVASWFCTHCCLEMPLGHFGRHVRLVRPPSTWLWDGSMSPLFLEPCPGPVWARNEDGRLFCPIHLIEITTHLDAQKRYLVCSYERLLNDVLESTKTLKSHRRYGPPPGSTFTPEGWI